MSDYEDLSGPALPEESADVRLKGPFSAAAHVAVGGLVCAGVMKLAGRLPGELLGGSEEAGWQDAAKLSAKALVAGTLVGIAMEKLGLESGNAGEATIVDQMRQESLRMSVTALAVAPVVEEGLFRLLPSVVADKLQPCRKSSGRWLLGSASALAFAAVHGIKNEEGEPVFPAQLFITGMAAWRSQRKGGYRHAVLSHAVNNAIATYAVLTMPQDVET
jgi:hypothetical protein